MSHSLHSHLLSFCDVLDMVSFLPQHLPHRSSGSPAHGWNHTQPCFTCSFVPVLPVLPPQNFSSIKTWLILSHCLQTLLPSCCTVAGHFDEEVGPMDVNQWISKLRFVWGAHAWTDRAPFSKNRLWKQEWSGWLYGYRITPGMRW